MNLNKIAYHIHRPPPSYCKITGQAEERDLRNERIEQFKKKLVDKKIRKPLQLIEKIKKTIREHIYEMSLEQLFEKLKYQNPEYDEQLIDIETRQIYQQIIDEDKIIMIKQEATILEYDPEAQPIKNKRKLKYQGNLFNYTLINNQVQNQDKLMNEKVGHDDILKLEYQLNQRLREELLNENIKFKKIDIIYEDDKLDPLFEEDLKQMKKFKEEEKLFAKEKELSTFRQDHIISQSHFSDDRSDMQVLQNMLMNLVGKDVSFAQRTTVRPIKIQKSNMENLINFQGKLKKDIINKVMAKIQNKNKQ